MVKIRDKVEVRSSMSKHDGQIGEVIDTNIFGQFKVEFEDGFVHPYEPSELKVVEPDKTPSEPPESTDQQQKTETNQIDVKIGELIPDGKWRLKEHGYYGITLEKA